MSGLTCQCGKFTIHKCPECDASPLCPDCLEEHDMCKTCVSETSDDDDGDDYDGAEYDDDDDDDAPDLLPEDDDDD